MPEYDAITPEQWIIALVLCLVAFGILWWLFWRNVSSERDEAEPAEIVGHAITAVRDWRPHILSSRANFATPDSAGLDRSVDQSAPTSLEPQTTSAPATGLNEAAPDMDAEQWEMPRISAYLSDDEFLVFRARQKTRNGGWRLSANQIVKTVGGDRTQVLKTIREVREGPAEFKPLSAEQQLRERLQLDQR